MLRLTSSGASSATTSWCRCWLWLVLIPAGSAPPPTPPPLLLDCTEPCLWSRLIWVTCSNCPRRLVGSTGPGRGTPWSSCCSCRLNASRKALSCMDRWPNWDDRGFRASPAAPKLPTPGIGISMLPTFRIILIHLYIYKLTSSTVTVEEKKVSLIILLHGDNSSPLLTFTFIPCFLPSFSRSVPAFLLVSYTSPLSLCTCVMIVVVVEQ